VNGRQFVDTNILIYAHDLDAGEKHETAARRIELLWETGLGIISIQVLQEFYVNLTRKISNPLPLAQARSLVESYSAWQVEVPEAPDILKASEIQERNLLSFWDALIVVSAINGGAELILSEDLNPGQLIDGVRIENPFSTGKSSPR
jgi:predicted nucleic acid-binding protein